LTDEQKQSISNICVEFHTSVNKASVKFKQELGRYFYVTPISYMQLLSNLEKLLLRKQSEMINAIDKYENGVKKLEECSEAVEKTKQELEELKPVLDAKEKEAEEIIGDIKVETEEAEKTKIKVAHDEEITAEKAEAASKIQT